MDPEVIPTPTPADAGVSAELLANMTRLLEQNQQETAALRAQIEESNRPKPEPVAPELDPMNRKFETAKQVRDEIDERAERKATEILQRADAEKERIRNDELTRRKELDKMFDDQLKEAEKLNLIDPVKDKHDEADLGLSQRREIFGMAAGLKTADLVAVAKQVKALHETGRYWDMNRGEVMAISGAPGTTNRVPGFRPGNAPTPAAPVGRSGQQNSGVPKKKIDYKTMHSRNLDSLIEMYER